MPQSVAANNGGPKGLVGDGDLKVFFQIGDEPPQLRDPHGQSIGRFHTLGQVEHIHLFALTQQLIHFLFAVAGGLAHDQIGKISIGTLVREVKTVAGFDEGTQVAGQLGLGGGNGFGTHTAQADGQQAGRVQDLQRRKGAKAAGHLLALLLGGLDL